MTTSTIPASHTDTNKTFIDFSLKATNSRAAHGKEEKLTEVASRHMLRA